MGLGVGPALLCSGQLRVMAVSLVPARFLWGKDHLGELGPGPASPALGWKSIWGIGGASEAKKVPWASSAPGAGGTRMTQTLRTDRQEDKWAPHNQHAIGVGTACKKGWEGGVTSSRGQGGRLSKEGFRMVMVFGGP